jgi:methyl-accepting chemotaxis protein
MRSHPTSVLVAAVFSAALVLAGVSAASGDDIRPAQVLKNYGLERQRGSTSSWSLAVEADVLKKFRVAKGLGEQLAAAQEAQQQLAMGGQDPRGMIDALQGQIDLGDARIAEIDQQLASLGPSVGNVTVDNWHNLLVQERNAIVGQQRRLATMIGNLARQGGGFEQQKWEFNGEVGRLRDSYRQAVDELRRSVDKILKNYAKLDKDAEVTKALADLSASTRSKQKLGPSRELQGVLKWLDRARAIGPKRAPLAAPRKRR